MALERHPVDGALGTWLDAVVEPPPALAAMYAEMASHTRAEMMTHPDLGRLLAVLVRATGGRKVLEVGTFVGTSAAWMAGALAPGGVVDTIENDPDHASLAGEWLGHLRIADRVRVHLGRADEVLLRLPAGDYDLAYIDADKGGYPAYLGHALRLVRPGGFILADNVFQDGRIGRPPEDDDERAAGIREYLRRATSEPRLETTVLTVGDGVALSAVLPVP